MPWCPKCKTEYKKGVTVCVDCGTELVDEQPEEHAYSKLCTLEKEEIAKKLMKYFEYSKIDSHYNYEEAELGYVVYVRDDEMKKAKNSFKAFYSVELEKLLQEEADTCNAKEGSKDASSKNDSSKDDDPAVSEEIGDSASTDEKSENDDTENVKQDSQSEDSEEDTEELKASTLPDDFDGISEEEEAMLRNKSKVSKMMYDGGAYEKKSDKLKDLKSTAATFFIFGVVGLVIVGLNLLGVIDFIGGTLQYCILIALFIGFFLVGINSLQRMKKVAKEVTIEEENTKKITDWLNTFITEETLNEFKDSSLSNEANFMHIMDGMKKLVVKEFGAMDESYLDYVTEEFYNNKFGEEDE